MLTQGTILPPVTTRTRRFRCSKGHEFEEGPWNSISFEEFGVPQTAICMCCIAEWLHANMGTVEEVTDEVKPDVVRRERR